MRGEFLKMMRAVAQTTKRGDVRLKLPKSVRLHLRRVLRADRKVVRVRVQEADLARVRVVRERDRAVLVRRRRAVLGLVPRRGRQLAGLVRVRPAGAVATTMRAVRAGVPVPAVLAPVPSRPRSRARLRTTGGARSSAW